MFAYSICKLLSNYFLFMGKVMFLNGVHKFHCIIVNVLDVPKKIEKDFKSCLYINSVNMFY